MPIETHFECTRCGACCRDTKISLTAAEAVAWLERGHEIQLLCEASPWPAELDSDPKAAHFRQRSFPVMSGSMPARVVLVFLANIVGPCPNLRADGMCGIYEDRPLGCRIYPAEINPFIPFQPANKLCPADAWSNSRPLFQRGTKLADPALEQAIELARSTDAEEADLKHRFCVALNITETALVHEAALVFSPALCDIVSGLAFAIACESNEATSSAWRFVTDSPETIADIERRGGNAILKSQVGAASFEHVKLRRLPTVSRGSDPETFGGAASSPWKEDGS